MTGERGYASGINEEINPGVTSKPCETSEMEGWRGQVLNTKTLVLWFSTGTRFYWHPEVFELLVAALQVNLSKFSVRLMWRWPRVSAWRLWSLCAFFDALCCCCSSWREFARLRGVQTEDLRWAVPPGAQQWLARHLLQVCCTNETFL